MIVFNDMVADVLSNKKCQLVVTESSIRGKKPNISLVFITQSPFVYTKNYLTKFYPLPFHENSR